MTLHVLPPLRLVRARRPANPPWFDCSGTGKALTGRNHDVEIKACDSLCFRFRSDWHKGISTELCHLIEPQHSRSWQSAASLSHVSS
uniref:Uncharacterized protein n=1 Tax=Cafeteria roenbergensis TaxID=33653 RepID=A0A7S0JUR0_CAFRO